MADPLTTALSRIVPAEEVDALAPKKSFADYLTPYGTEAQVTQTGVPVTTTGAATGAVPAAAPSYNRYDAINMRPGGEVLVGNSWNFGATADPNTPWTVVTAQNMSDPEIAAQVQRGYDRTSGMVTNLGATNYPGNANYQNPNLPIAQKQMAAYGALLNPIK